MPRSISGPTNWWEGEAACRGRWRGSKRNLGVCPAYRLTSQILAAVLKRLPRLLAPQSRFCNVQLALPLAAKGSYLSANSGWLRWADCRGVEGAARRRRRQQQDRRPWRGGGVEGRRTKAGVSPTRHFPRFLRVSSSF